MKFMNYLFDSNKNHSDSKGKRFRIRSMRTVSIAVLLAAAMFLVGCSGSRSEGPSGEADGVDKVIKIGMVGPLTGDYATYGQSVRNGVQTAIDEINADGGVNGYTLQLIAEDSRGESTEAANAIQKLIDQDRVTAIVGAVLSGETATVAPIAQDSGVLMVTPSSTAPGLTDIGDYIFRNVITDDVQAQQMAEYAVSELGFNKLAVIYANNDYGVALKDNFTAKAQELGASIVGTESYLDGDEDFRAQLTKIGDEIEALYIAGYYTEAAKIAQQARRQGIEAIFLGADGFYSEKLVELGGDAVEGAAFTAGFYSGDEVEAVQAFVSSYKQKYSQEPDMFAANAYDTMKIVAQALAKAGNDRAALKDEMAAIKDFPGVTGTTSFDAKGEAVKDVLILKIENGTFVRAS
jgi:branched-chain amino acid transport system substrate-binding protein